MIQLWLWLRCQAEKETRDLLARVQNWACSFRAETMMSKSSSGCVRCDRKEYTEK